MKEKYFPLIFLTLLLSANFYSILAEPPKGCVIQPNRVFHECRSCRKCRQFNIDCLRSCSNVWSDEIRDALIDCLIIINDQELAYNAVEGDIIDVVNEGLVMVIDVFIPGASIVGDIIDCAEFGIVYSVASSCMASCCSGGWVYDTCCYEP